jgi:hypothetical protein
LIHFHDLRDSSSLAEVLTMTVLDGLLIATLFGVFGTFEVWSLSTILAAISRMSSPPHPTLRPTGEGNRRDIGTDPDVSPVNVVSHGCRTIITHLLLQGLVLGGLGTFLLSMQRASAQQLFPETGADNCAVGVVSAAVLGVVLRTMWWNWVVIGNLYHRMVRPPNPTLPKATSAVAVSSTAVTATPSGGAAASATAVASAGPPNTHNVGATPTISPLDVLGQGCLEIAGRLILQVFLLGVLGSWVWLVHGYLSSR